LNNEYRKSRLIQGKSETKTAPDDKVTSLKRVQERLSFLKASISTEVSQEQRFYEEARQYEVEIHKKYAIPFACLIFVFVGAPLGIITRGGNYGVSAAITLGFYIFYWACLIGGEKFADRGMMSPFMSMWMGNIICGCVGILLTIKVNNESMKFLPGRLTGLFKRKKI
jgi:lipopolysaccharide export system permease protein